ncbi:hypothetical protein EJB05_13258, partial [Eragrostis curvula]
LASSLVSDALPRTCLGLLSVLYEPSSPTRSSPLNPLLPRTALLCATEAAAASALRFPPRSRGPLSPTTSLQPPLSPRARRPCRDPGRSCLFVSHRRLLLPVAFARGREVASDLMDRGRCQGRRWMNAMPVVLVFLLLVLVITSQFEWKQQIGDAADADPAAARRRQQLLGRDDAVKEKGLILSQEKNIQQLNQLIESLQRQLLHCRRGSNNTVHTTTIAATEVSEVEGHEIIDDDNL